MAVARIGDDRSAPERPKWNGGRPGETLLFREEWAHCAQGKKVLEGRCGRTIEAKPVFDQTCLIEPAKDVAWLSGGRDMAMAAAPPTACRVPATAVPLPRPHVKNQTSGNSRTRALRSPFFGLSSCARIVAWRISASADKGIYRRNQPSRKLNRSTAAP
ncbi:hypothetical protein NXC24_PB00484 (plasmid) [Rhizobium sp. NXC24]|nr:hypothetical protein NXC24_PB00484 [Rhizobium sp. NXC24]